MMVSIAENYRNALIFFPLSLFISYVIYNDEQINSLQILKTTGLFQRSEKL